MSWICDKIAEPRGKVYLNDDLKLDLVHGSRCFLLWDIVEPTRYMLLRRRTRLSSVNGVTMLLRVLLKNLGDIRR